MVRERLLIPLCCGCILIGCQSSTLSTQDNRVSSINVPQNSPEPQTNQAHSTLIVPGRSVGPLQLGDTRERASEVFGAVFGNKYFDEETLRPSSSCWPQRCCEGVTKMHWLDFERSQNGIYVYVSKGRIIQIEAATTRYATSGGITYFSPPDEVRRQYPNLKAFVRVGYHSEAEGGRNVIYWDDLNGGIAFEFWYSRTTRQRYLEAIIMHEPGVQLIPESCAASPSDWQQLDPYALEQPSSSQKSEKRP